MSKFQKAVAAFAAAGACTFVAGTGMASAATPTPVYSGNTASQVASYGFDGNAHLIVGGGSDTTYRVMQSLADLWGQSASSSVSQCVTNKTADPVGTSYPPGTSTGQPALNQCVDTTQFQPTNFDADTVTNADPAGSSAGIESLNGFLNGTGSGTYPYEGTNSNVTVGGSTYNGFGTPDFGRSSRGPVLNGSKGQCSLSGGPNNYANDELLCDTFWGFASDGVEVVLFNNNGSGPAADAITLTPAQIDSIYDCQTTTWTSIDPNLTGQPIVPWSMNTSSGTYATFNSLVQNGASDPAFAADANAGAGSGCVRQLANPALPSGNGHNPFENDIKSFVNDANSYGDSRPTSAGGGAAAGLSNSPTSTQNPENWIWFSSYGILSTFAYDANLTVTSPNTAVGSVAVTTGPAAINNVFPSASSVATGGYPFNRTLYYVTPKADADCPVNPNQSASTTSTLNPLDCDFTSGTTGTAFCNSVTNPNGQPELDVLASPITYTTEPSCNGTTGASYQTPNQAGTTGVPGAVREFTRFICRGAADQSGTDPFTGAPYSGEITSAIQGSGFQPVPHRGTAGSSKNLVSPGSSCEVLSQG